VPLRQALLRVIEALFRVLFTYDCIGEERLPASGPAVVAANHPSYLDPVLLSLQVARPLHFMAWDALFKVPVLGALIRLFGAFPVDVRSGRGGGAFLRAKRLLEAGEIVGIFPEGKRSRTGWMEPELRAGAARLAWETGVPLFPATIAGAYRAWPHFQSLPKPARIRVRYHEPIDPADYKDLPQEEAIAAMLAELRRRVDRSLLPGVKADLKMSALYRSPSPWPRVHESLPPLALATLLYWKTRSWPLVLPAYAYLLYLFLDHLVLPQRRLLKWLRNASPLVFLMAYAPWVLGALALPEVPAGASLAAILAGATFPYLYEHGRTALSFIQGLTIALFLALGALYVAPTGVGPHVSLPLFAAAYAWAGRTVFWRYTVPLLVAYALVCARFMHGGYELLPHATAGLLAWVVVRLLPEGRGEASDEPEQGASVLGLDL
jgi:1-acyl-sn-glycerol-3-phosphate acyltransferase